jgi:hypothetical protein
MNGGNECWGGGGGGGLLIGFEGSDCQGGSVIL